MRRWFLLTVALAAAAAAEVLVPAGGVPDGSWWSLLPPAVAISLALLLKDVVLPVFLGVWLGGTLATGGVVSGFFRTFDTSIRNALGDPTHVTIVVFLLLLGGMVGVMSRSGGTRGLVRALEPLAATARRSQAMTWLMGVLIFFDDYASTLIVGNAMRPVTDRHRVSREKLAYLVDSTAAPVACIAVISTWVGLEVGLVSEALRVSDSDLNPFAVFLDSIPLAFYPVFALAIGLVSVLSGRDWGPMQAAEKRARAGELLAPEARPLADYMSPDLASKGGVPQRWFNAALPLLTVVVATLTGLILTGSRALKAEGVAAPGVRGVIGAADPLTALLWASVLGLLVAMALAICQRLLEPRETIKSAFNGSKSMLMAVVVLTLAWSLGGVCAELGTAEFLTRGMLGLGLAAVWIPAVVFLVAAAVSFVTGTSWGTMAILTPLAVPLVLAAAPQEALSQLLAGTVSAILGGSVFGEHSSPISDTTIMSSMASGCDHVDHVGTQLPYAVLGAGLALIVGYAGVALTGLSPWVFWIVGIALVVLWFWGVGQLVWAGMDWYLGVLNKYAVLSGRARRREYWMFVLFNNIVLGTLLLFVGIIGLAPEVNPNILATIYNLAVLMPAFGVSVRRLHDTSRSGWWLLIGFIPIVGWIVLLVFMMQDSQAGDNQYGPNPKET